jgi:hypothetical protein
VVPLLLPTLEAKTLKNKLFLFKMVSAKKQEKNVEINDFIINCFLFVCRATPFYYPSGKKKELKLQIRNARGKKK